MILIYSIIDFNGMISTPSIEINTNNSYLLVFMSRIIRNIIHTIQISLYNSTILYNIADRDSCQNAIIVGHEMK